MKILFKHQLDKRTYIGSVDNQYLVHVDGYITHDCPNKEYHKQPWNLPVVLRIVEEWDSNYKSFDSQEELEEHITKEMK